MILGVYYRSPSQDGDSDVGLFCQELREIPRSVVLMGKFNFPDVLFVKKMVLWVLWWSVADLATVIIKELCLKTGGMQKTVSRATSMAFGRADFRLLKKLVSKAPWELVFRGIGVHECWSVLRVIFWEWRSRRMCKKFKQARQKLSLAG